MSHSLTLVLIIAAICSAAVAVPDARIVGGKRVDISKHPYEVSIRIKTCSTCPYMHKCGGSIYTDKVIITAAQCLLNLGSEDRLIVVAGANTRSGADGIQMPVAKIITHKGYNFWTIDNDIGLVILSDVLPLNEFNVKTIDVAMNRPLAGKWAIVCGWGWDAEDSGHTYFLKDTDVPIVSNDDCSKAYGAGEITERMVCAGLRRGGEDACQGDTGGPLVVDDRLVGLVSWGRGCGREGYPGVYTSVSSHLDWIAEQLAAIQKL